MTVPLTRQPMPGFRADTTFGVLLREQRVVSGLTQEELAERSGLSVRAIRNLEIGRTERPQQQSVELLAGALGLDDMARADLLRAARKRAGAPAMGGWHPGSQATGCCELPPDVPELTGRERETPAVVRALTEGPVPRSALVTGGPGVGKTAFVVHVAHRLRERFPDGQVYVDLDRPDDGEMSPHAVLGRVLRSLGANEPPASLEERAALLRAALTNRRVLLVLDNVSSEAQVRPLLTGASASALLLASRHQLLALPGYPVRLDPLGADAAVYLLAQLAGVQRVNAEPGAARAVADACSRLPLALHIAGSWLRARPRRPLADLADLLADTHRVLDRLAVADLSVRASIAGYDRSLQPEERHLAQRLALLDPDRFAPADLCHQLGMSEPALQDGVERLAHANLLSPASADQDGTPRYQLDPLVRRHFLARYEDSGVTQLRTAQWATR
ncbi:helix-turn-helix domain-containing protein [Actinophytocola oryzae]|uniref:NB-ARC domain-containing protein n=1 Tax=Actinophytocola oryzae TaxID=502181 RepID=A0A4R7VXG4_9PSEU|nr:helix-turn-helix domain-containing protein [Actinophytocola oryzae]TDV54826.1 NB-ARC domain-containing protein [Actinophytocola oryzae]